MTENDTPTGRSRSGLARAQALSPDRRAEIAKKASVARWGLKVSHRGNFKGELGVDVDCYVLGDETKTAVISQRGMGAALGFSDGGSRLPRFLSRKSIADYVGPELRQKLENPLVFQIPNVGPGATVQAHGYNAAILIDLCKAILEADRDGALHPSQRAVAKQAAIIVGASAKLGIQHLVYSVAGYSPSTDEVIAAFKAYVQEEARKYEPEFPPELYMQWHRLYDIPVPVRGKPWHFKYLTVRHVYYPLAQSSGKLYTLLKVLKAAEGDRKKKLFQFLNEIGARALRMQLGRILEMAESSTSKDEYERKIAVRFGGQRELDLVLPSAATASSPPSEQSPHAAPA